MYSMKTSTPSTSRHYEAPGDADKDSLTSHKPHQRRANVSPGIPPLIVIFLFIGLPALIVDQVTKLWVIHNFEDGVAYSLIPHVLAIEVVRNAGAAFSLAQGMGWFFVVAAIVVLIAIAWSCRSVSSRVWQVCVGLIAGGAAGNLIDRLIQPPGYGKGHVIDFINYAGFFVGNVADIFIVVGVIAVLLLTITDIKPYRSEKSSGEGSNSVHGDGNSFSLLQEGAPSDSSCHQLSHREASPSHNNDVI